ncbi:hypothetical protein FRC10_009571 [Ceratobasidium sp. 414]|nr:hypothetical protein FRC10_009571 [Ceratobasidium sp. 414]
MFYGYGNAVELSIICDVYSFGLASTVLVSLVLIKILVDKAVFLPNIFPAIFSGCLVIVPPETWTLYIMPLLFDLTMFILTVWKVWSLSQEFGATPLIQRLAKRYVTPLINAYKPLKIY